MKFIFFLALYMSLSSLVVNELPMCSRVTDSKIRSVNKPRSESGADDQQDDPRIGQVIEVVNRFFKGLKIKNQSSKKYRQQVTDDFFIYEMGKKYTLNELLDLFQTADRQWISTDWKLSDFRVSLDENSAHASYVNTGIFFFEKDGKQFRSDLKWLESVYLVKRGNQWKIKFLQSDEASRTTKEVASD